jgi:hypothetical protein
MLRGVIDAGIKVPHNPDIFPSDDRLTGKVIADYAAKLKKDNSDAYNKQFSGYKKLSAKPENISTYFKATKKAIDDEYSAGTMKNKLKNRNKKNIDSKSKPKPKTTAKKPTTTKKPTAKKTTTTKAPAKKATTTTTKKPSTTAKKPSTTTKKPSTSTTKKPTTSTKKTSTAKKTTSSKTKK